MSMESIEKLRGFVPPTGSWERNGAPLLGEIADEIESEVSERYMELPMDADGVPIHVGDELCGYGLPDGGAVVKALNGCMVIVDRSEDGVNYAKYGLLWDARETRHINPRTLFDVLAEVENGELSISKAEAEIRELFGVDA